MDEQESLLFQALDGRNTLAIPGRLELPTYGLGNRRSIRLSYGTANPTLIPDEAADRQPLKQRIKPLFRAPWPWFDARGVAAHLTMRPFGRPLILRMRVAEDGAPAPAKCPVAFSVKN